MSDITEIAAGIGRMFTVPNSVIRKIVGVAALKAIDMADPVVRLAVSGAIKKFTTTMRDGLEVLSDKLVGAETPVDLQIESALTALAATMQNRETEAWNTFLDDLEAIAKSALG